MTILDELVELDHDWRAAGRSDAAPFVLTKQDIAEIGRDGILRYPADPGAESQLLGRRVLIADFMRSAKLDESWNAIPSASTKAMLS